MSRNVPSLRFLLGIDTNSPLGPWMILMSLMTKQSSRMMETKAFNFSSSTGKTRTSLAIAELLLDEKKIETVVIAADGPDLLDQWLVGCWLRQILLLCCLWLLFRHLLRRLV